MEEKARTLSDVRIVPFRPEHGTEVAQLHREALPKAFLSSLGDRFLAELYRGIAAARNATVLVAESREGRCLGFVSGSADLRATYREVLRQRWPRLALSLLPSVFSPRVCRNIFQTIAYPFRSDLEVDAPSSVIASTARVEPPPPAELLSIGVSEAARGRQIGRRLVASLEEFFISDTETDRYRVVTDATDTRSNHFYERTGFLPILDFEHHRHPMRMYIKRLASSRPAGTPSQSVRGTP